MPLRKETYKQSRSYKLERIQRSIIAPQPRSSTTRGPTIVHRRRLIHLQMLILPSNIALVLSSPTIRIRTRAPARLHQVPHLPIQLSNIVLQVNKAITKNPTTALIQPPRHTRLNNIALQLNNNIIHTPTTALQVHL